MKKAFYEYRRLTRDVPPLTSAMLILSVVGMNLLANKSISLPVDWLALDCGFLFSWIVFLLMDIITMEIPNTGNINNVQRIAVHKMYENAQENGFDAAFQKIRDLH